MNANTTVIAISEEDMVVPFSTVFTAQIHMVNATLTVWRLRWVAVGLICLFGFGCLI